MALGAKSNSFWKMNPFVPSWSNFLSQAWSSSPPKLLETLDIRRAVQIPRGCILRAACQGDFVAIVEFWGRYFSVQHACRCIIPLTHIQKMVLKGVWEILIVVREDSYEILGTIVRRRLKNLHIREAKWAKAGVIDYYCVHPAWRKRGIGKALLDAIHNTGGSPMSPQLIFWEGLHPLYPPLSVGFFWVRKCSQVVDSCRKVTDTQECLKAWRLLRRDIWTEEPGEEISFWKSSAPSMQIVTVWNSFHCSVPHGLTIGVVLGGSAQDIETLANTNAWGILLVPRMSILASGLGEGWSLDSPFQWIAYNLSIGHISGEFPCIGL